jgi:hypothetical protein
MFPFLILLLCFFETRQNGEALSVHPQEAQRPQPAAENVFAKVSVC